MFASLLPRPGNFTSIFSVSGYIYKSMIGPKFSLRIFISVNSTYLSGEMARSHTHFLDISVLTYSI